MEPPAPWTHAVVESLATDAWIPVDDATSITEFAADPAYAVHHVGDPAALVELLGRPHDGTVRAARELLGMLPVDLFRAFISHLTGRPVTQGKSSVRPSRKGRR